MECDWNSSTIVSSFPLHITEDFNEMRWHHSESTCTCAIKGVLWHWSLHFLSVAARWLLRKGLSVTLTPPFLPTGRSGGRAGGTAAAQECGGVDGTQTELAARWGHISGQKINTIQSCQGAFNSPKPLLSWGLCACYETLLLHGSLSSYTQERITLHSHSFQ